MQRTYSEPHWDAERGAVMAFERVTLYGLPLVPRRRVGYATVDPQVARELFIRHALVEGDWQTRHHFFRDNARAARGTGRDRGARPPPRPAGRRRRDLRASTTRASPPTSCRRGTSTRWWKKQRHLTPDLLTFTRDDLLRTDDAAEHPDTWQAGDLSLPLTYRFEPGAADDGVTVHVPVEVLARLGGDDFAWQVPALREELVTALIRSLPKDLRRNFVPAPDTARAVLAAIEPGAEPLLEALQRELHRRTGVLVPIDAFDLDKLPAHLRVTFAVESADGTEVARGKDLDDAAGAARRRRRVTPSPKRSPATWNAPGCAPGPTTSTSCRAPSSAPAAGTPCAAIPALVDAGAAVDVRVFATTAEQDAAMASGHPPAAAAGGAVAGESR